MQTNSTPIWRTVLWAGLFLMIFWLAAPALFAQEAPVAAVTAPHDDGITGFFKTIGMIGVLILILSLVLIAQIVWMLLDLKIANALPLDFVGTFEEAMSKRRFKEAFELAKSEPSMIGKVLTAGMARLQYGLNEAREAAEEMVESLKMRKDHSISYMATLGTLGPLFGLVGTVYGMILSFGELGKGGSPNPSALAGGISHALYVTLLGISLSLPAIFFYSFFRNRIARIAIDVTLMADDLLTQMYYSSKKGATAAETALANTAAKNVAAAAKAVEA